MNEKINDFLDSIYYDSKTGFTGSKKLYEQAKEQDKTITMKTIKDYLKNQEINQTIDDKAPYIPYSNVKADNVKSNYQVDLAEIKEYRQNSFYKYLLIIIDVYSRFAFVIPLKSKNKNTVFEAIKENFEDYGYPLNMNTDLGGEFVNNLLGSFLKKKAVNHYVSDMEEDNKNSIVERFIGTLRRLITKQQLYKDKKRFIDDLPLIIDGYNERIHSTTEQKPYDVFYRKAESKQEYREVENPYDIGQFVRIKRKNKTFDKNTTKARWSKAIYKIIDKSNTSVYLDNGKQYRPYQVKLHTNENKNFKSRSDTNIKKIEQEYKQERKLKREGLDTNNIISYARGKRRR